MLVDQMRTCAAAITASQASGKFSELMVSDAARLLIEAADLLGSQQELLVDAVPLSRRWRHFDDGSKRGNACGNDPQALKSIGRQR